MATLDQLLSFLATHDIVDPTMECHEISVNKSQTKAGDPKHTIKNISDLLFQTLARPRNVKPEFVNSGTAVAKTDLWEGREHKLGYCRMLLSWKYIETPQFTGIVPEKPTIVLKQDIRVQKDTLRRLA